MTDFGPRYAIYFAPAPESVLWRFDAKNTGYDTASGTDIPTIDEPRHGIHTTLKRLFTWRWIEQSSIAGGRQGLLRTQCSSTDRRTAGLLSATRRRSTISRPGASQLELRDETPLRKPGADTSEKKTAERDHARGARPDAA
jgi:hypothetical protein